MFHVWLCFQKSNSDYLIYCFEIFFPAIFLFIFCFPGNSSFIGSPSANSWTAAWRSRIRGAAAWCWLLRNTSRTRWKLPAPRLPRHQRARRNWPAIWSACSRSPRKSNNKNPPSNGAELNRHHGVFLCLPAHSWRFVRARCIDWFIRNHLPYQSFFCSCFDCFKSLFFFLF